MKSRLFAVDENSLKETIRCNIASLYIPKLDGEHWIKTIADMMADMLQIEIGDYVFLWESKSKKSGVYWSSFFVTLCSINI